jgi:HK97 gp10 family phage protein
LRKAARTPQQKALAAKATRIAAKTANRSILSGSSQHPMLGGRLKSSIHARPAMRSSSGVGTIISGSVVAEAPYAIHVEFGTRHMKAQPFMRPAFHKQRFKFPETLQQQLRQVR